MTHGNAPLTPAGRHPLATRVIVDDRPISHIAAEAGVARSTLSKWAGRYRCGGSVALIDRSSAPSRRPTRLPVEPIELIGTWWRELKWSARRIHLELTTHDYYSCLPTVDRWLHRFGDLLPP